MMQYRALAFLSAALVAGGFACGSSSNGSNSSPSTTDGGEEASMMPDAGPTESGANEASTDAESPYPAVTPSDVPQVANAGGPTMTGVKVVPIFYANDDSTTIASVKDFLSKLAASKYWAGWTPEYGVGSLTIEDPVMISDTLPPYWDDIQIQTDLATRLADSASGFPAPDANTIYAYFFPAGVTITTNETPDPTDGGAFDAGASSSGDSCVGFYGYHDNITLNAPADGGAGGMDVSYAVMPRCPALDGMSVLDIVTSTASHEFAEAATDPFPSTNPAYSTVDHPHSYWSRALGGGEVGDMCAQDGTSFTKWPDLPYLVQRIWSNKAAKAGTDPCVPVPQGSVYFQSYPKMTDMLTISSRGGTYTALGAEIAGVGQSKTIEIDLASSGPTSGAWQVRPIDSAEYFGTTTYLSFAFQECNGAAICTGQNGTKLHLTITLTSAPRRGSDAFLLESRYQADGGGPMAGEYTFWAGLVGEPADAGTAPQDSGGGG